MSPSTPLPTPCRWDIFCSVVDNFGDIGICWRLARQLVAEHEQRVRLWVDDLASFRRIAPQIDPTVAQQRCRGVEVCRWSESFAAPVPGEVGEVVIEALACTIPDAFVAAMAVRPRPPLWLNLEYLSAEPWVTGCHGLPSPHPQLSLRKYFFFPGFIAGTGGLLRERDLLQRRRAFQHDAVAVTAFWASLGLEPPCAGELRMSLFGYRCDGLESLLGCWAEGTPLTVLIPEGPLADQVAVLFGVATAQAGDRFTRGALQLQVLPFLEQERYDRLLWACDLNFVRGEDSFVRAQWAGRPMVWQIYPQQEGAHWPKLNAFMGLYCDGLPAAAAQALQAFWLAWNRGEDTAASWVPFLAQQAVLRNHAERWAERQGTGPDLVRNLMLFCAERI